MQTQLSRLVGGRGSEFLAMFKIIDTRHKPQGRARIGSAP